MTTDSPRDRLAADVGPLLERLDQAENDVNEWKDWEARARGRADDLQQRLDQQTAEIERLGALVDEYDHWRDNNEHSNLLLSMNQAWDEAAAAQARADDYGDRIDAAVAWARSVAHEVDVVPLMHALRVLAGDAARPLPEPEQPPHQPASSFGYAYCAVCKADWPCHAAKERADV